MLRFYTNREMARKFNINLAKWKRWSREFLPPDPLGGMQSGYARQYHPDQVLTVYLGGYLVADLKFSVPEVRQILDDLGPWLRDHGFCFVPQGRKEKTVAGTSEVMEYRIFILRKRNLRMQATGLDYRIQAVLTRLQTDDTGKPVVTEKFIQTAPGKTAASEPQPASAVMLNMSTFLKGFVTILGQDAGHYPALHQFKTA